MSFIKKETLLWILHQRKVNKSKLWNHDIFCFKACLVIKTSFHIYYLRLNFGSETLKIFIWFHLNCILFLIHAYSHFISSNMRMFFFFFKNLVHIMKCPIVNSFSELWKFKKNLIGSRTLWFQFWSICVKIIFQHIKYRKMMI